MLKYIGSAHAKIVKYYYNFLRRCYSDKRNFDSYLDSGMKCLNLQIVKKIGSHFFCGGGTNSDFKKSQYQKNNLMSVIGCDELEHT